MVPLKISIPDGFLEDEVRCDHLVTKQMKEAWAVMLDLLAELDRVCTKYNIAYYASGGTLLGAIRHHGFVPWDDDIDIMMMRDQYEKLLEVGPQEFTHPYFFQYITTESGYQYGYVHLRNSDTTAIEEGSQKLKFRFNQGIKIDIFPVDNVVDDQTLLNKQIKKITNLLKRANLFFGATKEGIYWNNNKLVRIGRKVLSVVCSKLMRHLGEKTYKKFERQCMKYNNKETDNVGLLCLVGILKGKCVGIPHNYFSSIKKVPFEFLQIPVGDDYEKILELCYGDWRKPIKGNSLHSSLFVDTDKSYLRYIKEY